MERRAAKGLTASAAAVALWVASEGFAPVATVPTHGDVPTMCNGMTTRPDGSPVQVGDRCTRQMAEQLTATRLQGHYTQCVRKALGNTPVTQVEFDVATDFSGQYGCAAFEGSETAKHWRAGRYRQGYEALLNWRFITAPTPGRDPRWERTGQGRWRFDCSLPGNKECAGVWTRQQERYKRCITQ